MTGIELEPGDVVAERDYRIDRAALRAYADASGDQNPIHQDDAVASEVGLPGVIAHGMLTMGLAVQPVVDWLGQLEVGGRIVEYGVRFTRMVAVDAVAGAELHVLAKVGTVDAEAGTARIDLTVTFQGGTVLTKAQVLIARMA